MKAKKEAPELRPKVTGANVITELQHKDSKLIQSVKSLFLTGQKFTAIQINQLINSNDARKLISCLRSNGMDIQDIRTQNRTKIYWYEPDINQLSLFGKGCDNE